MAAKKPPSRIILWDGNADLVEKERVERHPIVNLQLHYMHLYTIPTKEKLLLDATRIDQIESDLLQSVFYIIILASHSHT